MMHNPQCSYGCGNIAVKLFSNGKWCCSESKNSCPEVRRKISLGNKGKNNAMYGKHHTEQSKRKISKKNKGKLKGPRSLETRNKISKSKKGKSRKSLSEEHKKNISKAIKGEKHYNFGKNRSEETKKKIHESLLGKGHPSSRKGTKTSLEIRKKIRLSSIKRIEKNIINGGQIHPQYNPIACKIIDEYGKQNSYNFKHAENGGEFHIKELGYWVDGYDKERNIVIEVDERHHFDINGNLLEKDIERQKEIQEFLQCKFIRIKF